MTNKPDVAALAMTHLLSWLPEGYTHCKYGPREWCESYLNNARDVIEAQASELTRLAANQDEQKAYYEDLLETANMNWDDATRELSEAKAEIARLTRTLIWIAHTYTEDSHGNMKTLPAADYQNAAKDCLAALKPDTGEQP